MQYAYDFGNRWVRKIVDPGGQDEEKTVFVYDGNQIALQFDGTGTGDLGADDLSHRYLWGPAVDQILADEQVHWDAGQQQYVTDELLWPLCDHLGTVRDVIDNAGTVRIHRLYDAFGNFTENPATATHLFAFTARPFDAATALQNNLHRWYDASTGRWLSEDPIGYRDGINLYCHVGNDPTNQLDPTGLVRHHWFMMFWRDRSGQAKVNAICQEPRIDINRYTTEYSQAEHAFIHSWVSGEVSFPVYQNMYAHLFAGSRSCCQFLIGMKGLMSAWHSAIRIAQLRGSLPGQVNPLDLIHYNPAISGDLPVSNYGEFNQKLEQVCGCSEDQKKHTDRRFVDKHLEFLKKIQEDLRLVDPSVLDQLLDSLQNTIAVPAPVPVPATLPRPPLRPPPVPVY